MSGSGSIAVAQPVGLKIAATGVPAFLGRSGLSVVDVFNIGRLALFNGDGVLSDLVLTKPSQLFYPVPDSMSGLAFDLAQGASMTVTELVAAPVLNSSLNPWDRHPAPLALGGTYSVSGGTALTTAWTYTVPAGRILQVARVRASAVRNLVASAVVYVQATIVIGGGTVVSMFAAGAPIGTSNYQDVPGDALYLPAGTNLFGQYVNPETGGAWLIESAVTGMLFDA